MVKKSRNQILPPLGVQSSRSGFHCYRVQASSARHTTGQWIRKTRCWGKQGRDLNRRVSRLRSGGLGPQNNLLIGVWMPGSFINQRERSNEELKSKGRIESEKQWGRGVLIWSIHRWARTNSLSLSWMKALPVQFSRSVMSDSLRPHGLQRARPPCPSPAPGVCSDSCPSSQWCHPTISSSVVPFSSCPQSFPAFKRRLQGPPGKPLSMIITIKAMKSKSKKSSNMGVRIGFLPETPLH